MLDAVVKADGVVGHIAADLMMIGLAALPNPPHLRAQAETLHHGVVPAIAFATHAANDAMPVQQCLVIEAYTLGGFNRSECNSDPTVGLRRCSAIRKADVTNRSAWMALSPSPRSCARKDSSQRPDTASLARCGYRRYPMLRRDSGV